MSTVDNPSFHEVRRSKLSMGSSERPSRNNPPKVVYSYSRPWTNSPFPHMR